MSKSPVEKFEVVGVAHEEFGVVSEDGMCVVYVSNLVMTRNLFVEVLGATVVLSYEMADEKAGERRYKILQLGESLICLVRDERMLEFGPVSSLVEAVNVVATNIAAIVTALKAYWPELFEVHYGDHGQIGLLPNKLIANGIILYEHYGE
ncbi:hypothetical protein HGA91_05460 [candidate division WWE3 bacterium]|nr:hypothetical protein [candidate division WWE3 bacterium]